MKKKNQSISYKTSSKQLEKDLRYLANMYRSGIDIEKYANRLYDLQIYGDGEDIDMIEDALNMKIQVFTENSVKIGQHFKNDHLPSLPWENLRLIRNEISHAYEGLNKEIIELLYHNIDAFLAAIEYVLQEYEYDA